MADARPGQMLLELSGLLSKDPRLGCSLVSHRDLGFCAACQNEREELTAWRLLAMSERGIPLQPFEGKTTARTLADDVDAGLHDRPHP